MVPIGAHVACAGLVGADMAARALRIRLLISRLGGRLSIRDALRLNFLGDAAAELTPFRIAGEPSRIGGLIQSRVPADAALLAVGAELVLSYTVIAALVLATSWAALPAWWASIWPAVYRAAGRAPMWVAALLMLAIAGAAWLVARRTTAHLPRLAGIRCSIRALAGLGWRPLGAIVVLSGLTIVARVGILWMLVSTLPDAPTASTVLVGSFVLLFGQALAPTPSGVGVVDMGVLGGAAGPLGGHALSVLLYWRVYTAVVPIVLAAIFALPRYGARPVIAMLGARRAARNRPASAVHSLAMPPGEPVTCVETDEARDTPRRSDPVAA